MPRARIWKGTRPILHRIKTVRGASSLHQTILWIAQDAAALDAIELMPLCFSTPQDQSDCFVDLSPESQRELSELFKRHPRRPATYQQLIHWLAVWQDSKQAAAAASA